MWQLYDELQIESKKVVLFRSPRDYYAPRMLDDFWKTAKAAPSILQYDGRRIPQVVAYADISIKRYLAFMHAIPAMTISSIEGEMDFDLLGLFLTASYRICSSDTVFVNRTLQRQLPPGCATPWFLSNLLGPVVAKKLYLSNERLNAEEALELGIVDRITEPDALERESLEVVQQFSQVEGTALASLVQAITSSNHDLDTYLSQAGAGFDHLIS